MFSFYGFLTSTGVGSIVGYISPMMFDSIILGDITAYTCCVCHSRRNGRTLISQHWGFAHSDGLIRWSYPLEQFLWSNIPQSLLVDFFAVFSLPAIESYSWCVTASCNTQYKFSKYQWRNSQDASRYVKTNEEIYQDAFPDVSVISTARKSRSFQWGSFLWNSLEPESSWDHFVLPDSPGFSPMSSETNRL